VTVTDKPKSSATGRAVSIRVYLFLVLVCVALTSSCSLFACGPYKCREAREGRALYAPLVTALEDFRARTGSYPATLPELVPAFIDAIPVSTVADGPTELEYAQSDNGYVLSFRYYGPGANRSAYSPGSRWSCDGYY